MRFIVVDLYLELASVGTNSDFVLLTHKQTALEVSKLLLQITNIDNCSRDLEQRAQKDEVCPVKMFSFIGHHGFSRALATAT
mmetsp:Transcript_8848/g.15378  ORF Transcript_8848/g.15378 Transcript_8848/m.15378 type:complete len:82 (+) Transcript_8848:198-443(+)